MPNSTYLWNHICRARRRLYNLRFIMGEVLSGYACERARFSARVGYDLDLKTPKSFNQKVCWKKIYDRNPSLPEVADKYAVRDYIRGKVGLTEAEQLLIPLLYATDDPSTIPFDLLPNGFVIKANHGSGTNVIVTDKSKICREHVVAQCKNWLDKDYGLSKHEWAYRKIKRKIVVEELLLTEQGLLPSDYKFHVFHGRCELIQVNQGLFSDKAGRQLTIFDRDWNKQPVFWEFPPADVVERPERLEEMIALAERLAQNFDYIRVDLYLVKNRIFFGELTNYPTSGAAVIRPQSFDFELGKKWHISPNYWRT